MSQKSTKLVTKEKQWTRRWPSLCPPNRILNQTLESPKYIATVQKDINMDFSFELSLNARELKAAKVIFKVITHKTMLYFLPTVSLIGSYSVDLWFVAKETANGRVLKMERDLELEHDDSTGWIQFSIYISEENQNLLSNSLKSAKLPEWRARW